MISSFFHLRADAVLLSACANSKEHVLDIIAGQMARCYSLDRTAILSSLKAREAKGSTGFGRSIAIPHGRIAGLTHPVAVCVTLEEAIDFAALDAEPVDLIWALVSPQNNGAAHLQALAHLSRLLRDGAFAAKLRGASDREAVLALMSDQIERNAA